MKKGPVNRSIRRQDLSFGYENGLPPHLSQTAPDQEEENGRQNSAGQDPGIYRNILDIEAADIDPHLIDIAGGFLVKVAHQRGSFDDLCRGILRIKLTVDLILGRMNDVFRIIRIAAEEVTDRIFNGGFLLVRAVAPVQIGEDRGRHRRRR